MTVLEFIATHGEEKTALKLIDKRIERIFGLSIFDLPDTSELAELVEELTDMLRYGDPFDEVSIKAFLLQIDIEFIERIVHR